MKYLKLFISPVLMGVLFVLFALSMAVATFLENDFGSAAAYKIVYGSFWFELILLLLVVNLIGQLIVFKMFKRAKLTAALFHLSFIVMIIGAGITRYFGWEGSIHIREGETQNVCYSSDKYMGYTVKGNDGKVVSGPFDKYIMTSLSADNYNQKLKINNKDYNLVLSKIIPNASEEITDMPGGEPIISIMVTKDMTDRESFILKRGDAYNTSYGATIGFDSKDSADVNISLSSGSFIVNSKRQLGSMNMTHQTITLFEKGKPVELSPMMILTADDLKIVPQSMTVSGTINAVGHKAGEQVTDQNAFIFNLTNGTDTKTISLWDKNTGKVASASTVIDGATVEVSYGSKPVILPFSIKLNDFILDRYPGSSSPSGYKSDVILIDKMENVERPFMIFMNNILNYEGYRFYQSSFDKDEKGTVLSVNHDRAGMMVTYSGYALLFLFLVLALINKKAVFHVVNAGFWKSNIRKTLPVIIFVLFLSGLSVADAQKLVPDKAVAEEFGKVLIQDQKGRTKPLFTLSNDILRKVTRASEYEGMTSMQVFLGIYLDFNNWKDVPLIRIADKEIQDKIGIAGKSASFADLVDLTGGGTYKISEEVNNAYAKAPGDRNKTDKELMKVDERVNIVYMIYKGDFLKLFPLKDGTNNWGSPEDALKKAISNDDSVYLRGIIPVLTDAIEKGDLTSTKKIEESISGYQVRFSDYALPSDAKSKAELFYYKAGIFEKLFPFYSTVGLIMLIVLIINVIRGAKKKSILVTILGLMLFAGFLFHTLGLGLRWYIAGHAPLSNGFESMVFISWVTLLAGLIFSRKSAFALSATAVLASMTLMVAHLSFMDPEITNLVPVLKSYWLTLHVSIITGSYGFLGLGAILGLIILVLIAMSNEKNRDRISATIDELTVINYKTLSLGLYFLTIGTFLGGVWANESWGRYWGWDPKETWALITIIMYSIVIHSRMIPGMKDIFTFNLLSLFAFSGVLMTYFGVNYYLSGMHSYAAGDPLPIPTFVYVTVISLAALSFYANYKYKRYSK